ncbi:MAG TPA: hypothetical protein VJ743_08315 [Albitalea sp.]|nr:hypothetical protein [Albitalea sp.]
MRRLLAPALLFVAIGLVLYAALYGWSEHLVWRQGRSNPFFKIAGVTEPTVDWVVLGASHAMPLDFDEVNAGLQAASGRRIVSLAGPGTGPLYNRFVLEHFLQRHRVKHLLYVVDAFAFYSRTWNEDRFADVKLLRRTPWDPALAALLTRYVRDQGVAPTAVLDYASGFSKINNRERFERDVWEGEAQFDRSARASLSAAKKRVAYLYPDERSPAALARYMASFSALLELARRHDAQLTVVKMPLPPTFRRLLPDEAPFDEALAQAVQANGARFVDFSQSLPDPALYFDTDHLNRRGVAAFSEAALLPLLRAGG